MSSHFIGFHCCSCLLMWIDCWLTFLLNDLHDLLIVTFWFWILFLCISLSFWLLGTNFLLKSLTLSLLAGSSCFVLQHGWLWLLSVACAYAKSNQATRTSSSSSSWTTILSEMTGTYELFSFALSEHVAPSGSTSVGNEPAGTLYDGTYDESVTSHDADQLVKSTVSTNSSSVASTNFAILSTVTSSHSTLLTNGSVSTNTTVLSRHTFYPFISATVAWNTSVELTKRSWPQWSNQSLWFWPQSSLARRSGSLRQPKGSKINGMTHFPGQSVNQLSFKSWTSKVVILWLYHWRPCCINRPTTSGFGNWPMGKEFTWSLRGTSRRLSSLRSYWRSSEAAG